MFSLFPRGLRSLPFHTKYDPQGPIRLDEARFDAWAKALGQTREPVGPPRRRAHPGMLPDVDFANVERAPRRSSLSTRLARVLVGKRAEAPDAGGNPSGETDAALGGEPQKPYLRLIVGDAHADASGPERSEDRAA